MKRKIVTKEKDALRAVKKDGHALRYVRLTNNQITCYLDNLQRRRCG